MIVDCRKELQSRIINQPSKIENRSSRFRTDWILLAGFCAFLFFYGLAYFGLVGADEPRYAQIAREMLARGDWITPVLGGKPWLEKPPLYYWQAMLAYSVFGVSDWAARLPSAIDATLMVIAIYFFRRKSRLGLHLDGALMCASSAGVIGFARAASTDMPLAAMFTLAMLAWYAWYEGSSARYLAASYVFIALATLAKGPVAPFLALVIIGLFTAVKKDYILLRRTLWIPGIVLCGAVTFPWFVAVQIRNPEFFRIFILQHNLARFGSNLYHHKEPFWYFVPVTLLALIPWVVLACASLTQTVRGWWTRRQEVLQSDDALNVFLAIWLLVPVIFFSISQSKLPGYILPAVPAGVLLAAEYARRHLNDNDRRGVVVVMLHSIVATAPLTLALMIQYLVLQHRLPWGRAAGISFGLASILAIGLALTLLSRVGWGGLRFTLVPVALGVAAVLRLGSPSLDATLSARPVANEISALERKRLPLAVFHVARDLEFGLAFYRNQVIERYESGEIPPTDHLLVAPEGMQVEIAKQVQGRRVSYLGSFAPQGLDYYWVAGKSR
ncbi:MAG TPA: glycosyltransferase family 39 protein [Terriglobales bacterium]|nr:glycosyltransferase family 39 protein [Terriglobales bacterium]